MSLQFEFISQIAQVPATEWDALGSDYPFTRHGFLHALEVSGCVSAESGWQPQHVLVRQNQQLIAALPLYQKRHSYGEYVFDWAWAEAYQRYGFHYYPKLLSAIPFTPVPGPRLLCAEESCAADLWPEVAKACLEHAAKNHCSSVHWLYNLEPISTQLATLDPPLTQRRSVQFHWFNRGYEGFEDFLASFASRKRKNVNKERAKVSAAGISVKRRVGSDITPTDLAFFYRCYQQTYLKRSGHGGYLNWEFFQQVQQALAEQMLLVIAEHDHTPVAAALYFFDSQQLYGRYWGALHDIDGLHFECCYYQGIEFCIEQCVQQFNPGTQGEHKILRGFEPRYCYSNHWLARPEFQQAVDNFVQQENDHLRDYVVDAERLLPYKQQGS